MCAMSTRPATLTSADATVPPYALSDPLDEFDDISRAKQRARRRRTRNFVLIALAIALPFLIRDAIGLGQLLSGHAATARGTFTWPFSIRLPPKTVDYIPSIILIGLLVGVLAIPLLGAGRSPHILFQPGDIGIGFDDVVGAGAVVDEVRRTLDLFRHHRMFADSMGGNTRRAILFEGPPGTGKTYLAKAIAAEAGVPFLFVSSSAFQSMFYGQTNRKVRSFFKSLNSYARKEGGAIGFIEEIDAIGASRAGMRSGGGGEGVAGVVNELLIQLQSFDQPPYTHRLAVAWVDAINRHLPRRFALHRPVYDPPNVLVVGATNRAADLDPALLRPGRFDRTITVDLPGRDGRREIIDYYLARKAHVASLDTVESRDELAGITAGYSPVMIEHLFDEALMCALRRGARSLSPEDLASARMSTELGLTQAVTYSDDERRRIATHEAGHATVAALIAPERRLEVLSIVKRGGSLGLLAHVEIKERFTQSAPELENLLRIAMGGMAAEAMLLGATSSGVAGDLAAATKIAAAMVGSYGMAGSLLSVEAVAAGGDLVARVLSDEPSRKTAERLLATARATAEALISENSKVVEALRDALLARGELVGDEITQVINEASRGAVVSGADR